MENYRKNVRYYRSCLSVVNGEDGRDPHSIDYQHLCEIDISDLDTPTIYYACGDSKELRLVRDGTQPHVEIEVRWSENVFGHYNLLVRAGEDVVGLIVPSFTSDQAKVLERTEDFLFVVHYALFALSAQTITEIDHAVDDGIPVVVSLATTNGSPMSKDFPWRDVDFY
jgi:hypothetical protein